jgi:hypothetical protein
MTPRHLLLVLAVVAAPMLGACGRATPDAGQTVQTADTAGVLEPQLAVEQVVAKFGSMMQQVSLLAPDSIASARLQDAYGGLVTPDLLADWMARPDSAPGRRVSSPWPDRIEVQSVTPAGTDEFDVVGEVVYLTSQEQTAGSRAASEPARLHVRRTGDGSWRISAYRQGAAAAATRG